VQIDYACLGSYVDSSRETVETAAFLVFTDARQTSIHAVAKQKRAANI
jgi:hypothetical protein